MAWITNGTVNLTANSDIVTGNGTTFDGSIQRGDFLVINGLTYQIDGVVNSAQLKLAAPWAGQNSFTTSYGIARTGVAVADLNDAQNTMIDLMSEIIENGVEGGDSAYESAVKNGFVGTEAEWIESLKGRDGVDGTNGVDGTASIQSVVDLTQFAGQVAGGKGIKLIIPVSEGAPSVSLTQQSSVIIPAGSTNAGIGIWAYLNSSTGTLGITLGLTEVPLPQPEVPSEPIDLSGAATFYAPLGAITPLGISLNGSTSTFTLSRAFTDSQLKIRRKVDTPIVVPTQSRWTTGASGSPYPVTGNAVALTNTLSKRGDGTTSYANGRLTLNRNAYLITPKLNIDLPSSSDAATTQCPPWIMLEFKGNSPQGGAKIGELRDYGGGYVAHQMHWNNRSVEFVYDRAGGGYGSVTSDEVMDLFAVDVLVQTRWDNDTTGTGGWVTFYVNGEQYGERKATEYKPRITPAADLQINASVENTANSVDNLVVEYIGLQIGKPDVSTAYNEIADGPVTADDIQNLVLDATDVTTQQPARVLSYTASGGAAFDLTLVVGEMVLPAGRAYKAVLMDFSSGVAVPHANELVMTKPYAQNCRFEDTTLYSAQGSWTEVGPQGAAPIIDGIRYGCEGIRQGNYVQFQFVYSNDRPSEPFGDVQGLNTYMRPHKWYIYDNAGTLLSRVEKPNGEPLNAAGTSPVFGGPGDFDGLGRAMITDSKKWYPHGTTRTSIIWRSHDPVAYSQAFIRQNMPTYEQRVPFASRTSYSTTGYDLRLFAGPNSEGQANNFANWLAMPVKWGEQTYSSIQTWGQNTQDPYTLLYKSPNAMTPNAGLWLEYTPWNTMGRSTIVGPGGVRDDRQIMPEMVAQAAQNVNRTRAHDGAPVLKIALDYLTGYASDPYNAVVNGKITPLFRNNARRAIGTRSHYYGYGDAARPADQSWYYNVGRLYEWTTDRNPLRASVPYAAVTADKPYFGGFEIDNLHAHQFPGWGSLMFQSPEFAMLQVNFSDQSRMYSNEILGQWANSVASRENAWPFMHATLLWKTASNNSTRLYSRDELIDWAKTDLETFYDNRYASTPGFLNPPTNIMGSNGQIDDQLAIYAGTAKFGPCYYNTGGLELSEFQCGYWLSALHAAHKVGFLDALRAASPKCEALVNWLLSVHRRRIVGRINDAMEMNMYDSDYQVRYWKHEAVIAAGGNIANLPKTFKEAETHIGKGPSWDTFLSSDGNVYGRDGQANDQLLAGPSLLKDMGMTGTDLDAAETKAEQLFQQKYQQEFAKGYANAGSDWFKWHQSTNNRPMKLT